MACLRERDIHAVFHYVPLHSSPAGKKYGKSDRSLPVTDDLSDRVLRLPLYYEMTEEDADQVVNACCIFFNKADYGS
jgi:dTDP-4-amino-4,6-dideoxygalactose transaminase